MDCPIDIARKTSALLAHFTLLRQGKNLIPARVGEHGAIPAHETVDASELFENLRSRTKQEVIRVGQQHARTGHLQTLDGLSLYRCLCAYRHEDWSLNLAVQRLKCRRPRFGSGGGFVDGEVEGHSFRFD